ncbi:MAG: response regulator transcription factor [Terracoccus sp.]
MRIVIGDDHRVLLEALGSALRTRGHDVVGLALTPEEALTAVAEHDPDVCLLDLHFPGGTSLITLRTMTSDYPRTKVVVFSASSDPTAVAGVLAIGGAGFLSKSMSVDEVCVMLDRAAGGQVAVDAGLLQRAFQPPGSEDPLWVLRFLTDREWDVLHAITRGHSTRQIAAQLGVQTSTARTHVQNLLAKLGVHSRLEAAALIADHGTVQTWPVRLRR